MSSHLTQALTRAATTIGSVSLELMGVARWSPHCVVRGEDSHVGYLLSLSMGGKLMQLKCIYVIMK